MQELLPSLIVRIVRFIYRGTKRFISHCEVIMGSITHISGHPTKAIASNNRINTWVFRLKISRMYAIARVMRAFNRVTVVIIYYKGC